MLIAENIKNVLTNIIEEITENKEKYVVNPEKDFVRNRKLDFKTMIELILGMQGNTLGKELYDVFKTKAYLVTTSAFVQQRGKILPETFKSIFGAFNKATKVFDTNTYDGYKMLAVDGSDLSIAKNEESKTYVKGTDTKEGYNQFHINALYDVLNYTYADLVIQAKQELNETRAAIEMIERNTFEEPTIIMADRGYGSFNLFEYCNRKDNVDYLIRVREDFCKETKRLPLKELDEEFEIEIRTTQTKEDKQLYKTGKAKYLSGKSKYGKYKTSATWDFEKKCKMTIRVVRFKITDDSYETIITSLNRFRFPIEKIKEMYHLRWGIETSFLELKYAIGLVNLHARKEEYIIQEIYAKFIMYNFCERIIEKVVLEQKSDRKHDYAINHTMGIYACLDYFKGILKADLMGVIKGYLLPIRPNRSDERKMKSKGVVYFTYRVA